MSDVMDDGVSVDFEPPDHEPQVDDQTMPEHDFPGATADAPYGYTKAGKPRKRRPNRAGSRPGGRRKTAVNYAGIVHDLIMSVAQPLMLGGATLRNTTMIADGWLLADRAGPIATAMGDIAQQEERVARALEKIAEVSPYAALTAAVMPAIPQLLVNHGRIKAGFMGTVDPDVIAAQFFHANPTPESPGFDYDVDSEEIKVNGSSN